MMWPHFARIFPAFSLKKKENLELFFVSGLKTAKNIFFTFSRFLCKIVLDSEKIFGNVAKFLGPDARVFFNQNFCKT